MTTLKLHTARWLLLSTQIRTRIKEPMKLFKVSMYSLFSLSHQITKYIVVETAGTALKAGKEYEDTDSDYKQIYETAKPFMIKLITEASSDSVATNLTTLNKQIKKLNKDNKKPDEDLEDGIILFKVYTTIAKSIRSMRDVIETEPTSNEEKKAYNNAIKSLPNFIEVLEERLVEMVTQKIGSQQKYRHCKAKKWNRCLLMTRRIKRIHKRPESKRTMKRRPPNARKDLSSSKTKMPKIPIC